MDAQERERDQADRRHETDEDHFGAQVLAQHHVDVAGEGHGFAARARREAAGQPGAEARRIEQQVERADETRQDTHQGCDGVGGDGQAVVQDKVRQVDDGGLRVADQSRHLHRHAQNAECPGIGQVIGEVGVDAGERSGQRRIV